ncbi:hypothetical protein DPX16_14098 [Anabarilius grahami]|uniref:Uncharacterized protein n=1 Tax=Anabarilius grahami TaxID=495550 RepID=A0A3N0Y9T3_ANAGA|nr:hypothetical protein DPX16_14098 [Anabarilius grahami]
MIILPDGPTSSDADSTCGIGRKKADEDQLKPTVRNTLRKLSRPTDKNCPTADRRLAQPSPGLCCPGIKKFGCISRTHCILPCRQKPPIVCAARAHASRGFLLFLELSLT